MEKDESLTYELMDGLVMLSPRPGERHQRILFNLSGEIYALLKKAKHCQGYTELEMQLDDCVLIPDLMIICEKEKLSPQRYQGAPLIAMEILSPHSAQRDLLYKLNKYQSFGVKEYWIVDPKTQSITMHDYAHQTTEIFTTSDTISSQVLPQIAIAVADIFA